MIELEIVDCRPLTSAQLELLKHNGDRPAFDGKHYNIELDHKRLSLQFDAVENFMKDHKWHTVQEVAFELHIPENSASAQIRNLRKQRYGGYLIDNARIQPEGLFMYRMRKPEEPKGSDGRAFEKWLRAEARKEWLAEKHER